MERLRGTCIAVEGSGVLLRGPSGSGKSDLALRLIDAGGRLVADDYTDVSEVGGRLVATAPPKVHGLLEVRGIGIIRLQAKPSARLIACVDLVPIDKIERMPVPEDVQILGVSVPRFVVCAAEPSSVAKVALVVRIASGTIMRIA
jgi:serine kinase of HPr protein (carbohydrate metabolism regulator)